jgi:hydroxyethylthiazole kinase-like uncharacterized protein yjeF
VRPIDELLAAHPLRLSTGGKDESGSVVVIGGPPECPGAALLCATAALRVGAGRVRAVVHPEVRAAAASAAWELYVEAWDQTGPPPAAVLEAAAEADVVVIGPGHGVLPAEVVAPVVGAARGNVVLDAGALPAAASLVEHASLVLAPNEAEARSLVGERDDPIALARAVACLTRHPAAVRGARTTVTDGERAWTADDLPAGLGTPGSGDVCIGVLAGLLAMGNDPLGALAWATTLHADAGRLASEGAPVGYLANDVLARLPDAIATRRRR